MLTKEAKTVLYQLYKEYLVRRDGNVSRSRAKCFSSAESIHASLFPDWSLEDVEDVLRELGRNGFLDNSYADDTIYDSPSFRCRHRKDGESEKGNSADSC